MSTLLQRGPLLEAPTPQAWLDTWLWTWFASHEEGAEEQTGHRWVGPQDVLGDDGAFLRAAHRRILDTEGGTPQMAAKWLIGWVGGTVAGAVGFGLAAGSTGLLVDTAALRWRLHPDGWVDRVGLDGCEVVVAADHPWAGLAGVHAVDDDEMVVAATVRSLVTTLTPLVDLVGSLAKVGRRGLWAEVADGLGMSVAYQPHLPVSEHALQLLRLALLVPGAPWRCGSPGASRRHSQRAGIPRP